jgi:hypothetical protein
MTPITLDSPSAVASVRRTPPAETSRPAADSGAPAPANNNPRPSVVLNLNSSANQAATNGVTYGNPRATGSATAANQANGGERNNPVQARSTEQQDAERIEMDRRNLQSAQASSSSRQAVAANPSA